MAAHLTGIAASSGLGIGRAFVFAPNLGPVQRESIEEREVAAEIVRYRGAVKTAVQQLTVLYEDALAKLGQEHAAIFEAQRMMLEDPTLDEGVVHRIESELHSAEKAAQEAFEEQALALESLGDAYFSARALDLRDILKRVQKCLRGEEAGAELKGIPAGTVIIASDLTPSDTASLDASKVAGIVLDMGGRTSHTAILARSLGIPAVVGTKEATLLIGSGDLVVVDGDRGEVFVNPSSEEEDRFRREVFSRTQAREKLKALKDLPAVTRDGRRVEVAVNIGGIKDVDLVLNSGADGVGLFRTEFLFIERSTMPSEEEQFEAYREVLQKLSPRPVVVRTLDAGGDKNIPYLELPREENPFLGYRAIRLCLNERELFRTQLRALLRASPYGKLKIMFPMIANIDELREAKKEFAAVKAELLGKGIPVSEDIEVGIMVEVPSAAVDADILAKECDFFSIGTNDLVQYTMAADRGNPKVSYLSSPFYPAVLKLIYRTIQEAHKAGIWVGMCGEMAGMPEAIGLLVGMGIDELSMSAGSVLDAKDIIRNSSVGELREWWNDVSSKATVDEVKSYLDVKLSQIRSQSK